MFRSGIKHIFYITSLPLISSITLYGLISENKKHNKFLLNKKNNTLSDNWYTGYRPPK